MFISEDGAEIYYLYMINKVWANFFFHILSVSRLHTSDSWLTLWLNCFCSHDIITIDSVVILLWLHHDFKAWRSVCPEHFNNFEYVQSQKASTALMKQKEGQEFIAVTSSSSDQSPYKGFTESVQAADTSQHQLLEEAVCESGHHGWNAAKKLRLREQEQENCLFPWLLWRIKNLKHPLCVTAYPQQVHGRERELIGDWTGDWTSLQFSHQLTFY